MSAAPPPCQPRRPDRAARWLALRCLVSGSQQQVNGLGRGAPRTGGGARAIKGALQAAGATRSRQGLRSRSAVPGTPRAYHPASYSPRGPGRARMGTQLGKFKATWLGEGMRAGRGGVNVEPITSPFWPVGPCALLLISPVLALAHCAPSLAALRATPRLRDSPGQRAWGGGLASSSGCDDQGRSRPRLEVGPIEGFVSARALSAPPGTEGA